MKHEQIQKKPDAISYTVDLIDIAITCNVFKIRLSYSLSTECLDNHCDNLLSLSDSQRFVLIIHFY